MLAQLDFTHIVQTYNATGILFRTHLHVPVIHPTTGSIFYERQDEGNAFKVSVFEEFNPVGYLVC